MKKVYLGCVFVVLMQLSWARQCPPGPLGTGQFLNKPSGCATFGLDIEFTPQYSQLDDNAIIRIDWGDGSAIETINAGNTGVQAGLTYNTPVPHTYTEGATSGACIYEITAWVESSCYTIEETTVTNEIAVFNTDNFGDGGAGITLNPMLLEVCAGTEVEVDFQDVSPWNCTNQTTLSITNNRPRWTRWVHGVFNDISGDPVLVDGNVEIFPFAEAVVDHSNLPVLDPQAPGNRSLTITVPATAQVGEEFHVRLDNWNQCNPYVDGGGVPTGLNPVSQTAIIRVIAPPDPAVNTTAAGPYCVGEAVDFVYDGVHQAGYTYLWDFGDGSTSAQRNPSHIFTSDNGGVPFDVTVTVTNTNTSTSCQAVTTPTYSVTVNATPGPVIAIEDGDGNPAALEFCGLEAGQFLYFELDGASTISNPANTDFTWNFYEKDNFAVIETSLLNPVTPIQHFFQDPGVYRVEVIANDNLAGCSASDVIDLIIYDHPEAAFNAQDVCEGERTFFSNIPGASAALPVTVNGDQVEFWDWDFSYDGLTFNTELRRTNNDPFEWFLDGTDISGGTEPATSVDGTYTVALRITTQNGCSDVFERTLTVYKVPSSAISVEDGTGNGISTEMCEAAATQPVYFDLAGGATIPHPGNTDYTWNFYSVNDNTTVQTSLFNPARPVARFFIAPGIYKVELIMEDALSGCSFTTSTEITVYDRPIALFEATDVCEGERTLFSGISDNLPIAVNGDEIQYWDWDFSYDGSVFNQELRRTDNSDFHWFLDGASVNGEIEPATSQAGAYKVALRMTTTTGQCFHIFEKEVVVKPEPVALLNSTYESPICPNEEIVFFNESTQSPQVTAYGPIEYQLIISDIAEGVADTVNFLDSQMPYRFTNASLIQKNYSVNLLASANYGCFRLSDTVLVTVNPQVTVGFADATYDPLLPNCSPLKVNFVANDAAQNLNPDSYTWTIEGESGVLEGFPATVTNGSNPFHSFAYTLTNTLRRNVLYRVRLEAEKADVCVTGSQQLIRVDPVPAATFTLTESLDSCSSKTFVLQADEPGLVDYTWSVGLSPDQLSENGDRLELYFQRPDAGSPDLTGVVGLQTTNAAGCSSPEEEQQLLVENMNVPVVVDFSADPEYQLLPNSEVQIENRTSGGEDLQYLWRFGDGSTSTEENPGIHQYQQAGIYTISLEVTNGFCVESMEKTVVIEPTVPEVDFVPDRYSGCRPLTVSFRNTSQFADTTSFTWDFGDGQGISTLVNPSYTYSKPGVYTVTLQGKNSLGVADKEVKEAIIEVYEVPIAAFELRPREVYLPDKPVFFSNLSIGADSVFWDFGDGSTSSETDPVHYYKEKGNYPVTLVASNVHGCADTLLRRSAVEAIEGGRVVVPNAFTPNPAGPGGGAGAENGAFNDVFLPQTEGVTAFRMLIYNKWGQILYESTSPERGWDGYYQGRMCPQDVYVYRLELTYINGQKQLKMGDVTLIR